MLSCRFNLTRALKREPAGRDQLHTLSVTVDMKRRSPTILEHRDVIDFDDCGHFAGLLAKIGVNALFANTDDMEYGGKWSDLKDASKTVRALQPQHPPAVICKDIIIHPIQVSAQDPTNSSLFCIAGPALTIVSRRRSRKRLSMVPQVYFS